MKQKRLEIAGYRPPLRSMGKIGKLSVVNADNLLENHACGITNKRI